MTAIIHSDTSPRSTLGFNSLPSVVCKRRHQPNGWCLLVERVKGIEPSLQAWEARVLPLNYTRVFVSTKFDNFRQFSTIFDASEAIRCNSTKFDIFRQSPNLYRYNQHLFFAIIKASQNQQIILRLANYVAITELL